MQRKLDSMEQSLRNEIAAVPRAVAELPAGRAWRGAPPHRFETPVKK